METYTVDNTVDIKKQTEERIAKIKKLVGKYYRTINTKYNDDGDFVITSVTEIIKFTNICNRDNLKYIGIRKTTSISGDVYYEIISGEAFIRNIDNPSDHIDVLVTRIPYTEGLTLYAADSGLAETYKKEISAMMNKMIGGANKK